MKLYKGVCVWRGLFPMLVLLFSLPCLADTTTSFALRDLVIDASPGGYPDAEINVTIVETDFSEEQSDIDRCLQNSRRICSIDGRIPYGVVFDPPATMVKSITVVVNGRTYYLDVSDMYNAWSDNKNPEGRYFSAHCYPGYCKFRGIFGYGVEAYIVEWEGGAESLVPRTMLTYSRDLVHSFTEDIGFGMSFCQYC